MNSIKNPFQKIFFLGLVVRIIFLFLMIGPVPANSFIPFFDIAVTHLLSNPWSLPEASGFPYGSFLYAILVIPKFILYQMFGEQALGQHPLSIFSLKLPLLAFDYLMFFTLERVSKNSRYRQLVVYYWLNPALFYITYIQGQLDVVAMSLAITSIFFLLERRYTRSAVVMAMATLCKVHVVAIVPFIAAFLWNRLFRGQARFQILRWIGIWLVITVIGFLPVALATRLENVLSGANEVTRIFGAKIGFGGGTEVYIGIAFALLVIGRLVASVRISDQGLFYGAGAILSAIVLFTDPPPGWFFWTLPFYSLFFSVHLNVPVALFWGHVAIYICHFVFLPELKLDPLFTNTTLSMLQASHGALFVTVWMFVINSESLIRRRSRPLAIGIAGDSGSGKSHLTQILTDVFNPENCVVLEGDNYHKWERGHQNWERVTHLNPHANHLWDLSRHMTSISRGISVSRTVYSHSTGTFSERGVELRPSRTLIVQGLHALFLKKMRDSYDLRIFLKPDPLVRIAWKVRRDSLERGYDPTKVLGQLEKRKLDSERFIDPQEGFADLVIKFVAVDSLKTEDVFHGLSPEFYVQYSLSNDLELEGLLQALRTDCDCEVTTDLKPENLDRIYVTVKGCPSADQISLVAEKMFDQLRQLTRGFSPPRWRSGHDGLSQLFVLAILSYKQESADA